MIVLKLTKGFTAWLDEEDAWALLVPWYADVKQDGRVYARRTIGGRNFYLHREIMNHHDRRKLIDHANGNTLDNRRFNLRSATGTQNAQNKGIMKSNKLGVKGVYICSSTGRYRAEIRAGGGKRIKLGRFDTLEEAKAAYDAAAVKYHGDFAHA